MRDAFEGMNMTMNATTCADDLVKFINGVQDRADHHCRISPCGGPSRMDKCYCYDEDNNHMEVDNTEDYANCRFVTNCECRGGSNWTTPEWSSPPSVSWHSTPCGYPSNVN